MLWLWWSYCPGLLPRSFLPEGVTVSHDPEEIFRKAQADELTVPEFPGEKEVFVVGGEDIYKMALPFAKKMFLTLVHIEAGGDASFPDFPIGEWSLAASERYVADEKNDIDMTFEVWERD